MARFLCLLLLVAALVVGCREFEPAEGATPAERVYNQNCIVCHGKTGAGADGPNLLQGDLTRAYIELKVRAGGGLMPSFDKKLTPEQIQQAIDWVAELRRRAGRDTPGV